MVKKLIISFISIALLFSLVLLFSGARVLFFEQKVNPGDFYEVPDYGNLGKMNGSSWVCRYFTGRSVITSVFRHSSNNFMGRDQCPFFVLPD